MSDYVTTINGITYTVKDHDATGGYDISGIETILERLHGTTSYTDEINRLDPADRNITIHIDSGGKTGIYTDTLEININSDSFIDGNTVVPSADWEPMQNTLDFGLAHEIGHFIDAKLHGSNVFNDMSQAETDAISFENSIREEVGATLRAADGHEAISPVKARIAQYYWKWSGKDYIDFDQDGDSNELPVDYYNGNPPPEPPVTEINADWEIVADWVSEVIGKIWDAIINGSPLVMDIDGDGIELSSLDGGDAVYWDIDADGVAEASAWVTGGDGLLAVDLNRDGIVNDNTELFGNTT